MIHNCLQGFEIMHIGNDSNLGKNDKICNILSSVAPPLLFFFFFARVATFPCIINFSEQRGEVSDSLFSYCFLAFFRHHIAGVWREHLLKVIQKFEKIEADATLSTLVEFTILGQTIRFASLGSVKFAVTVSYGLLLAVLHSFCSTLYITFSPHPPRLSLVLSHTDCLILGPKVISMF